jgi:hypothetical protein
VVAERSGAGASAADARGIVGVATGEPDGGVLRTDEYVVLSDDGGTDEVAVRGGTTTGDPDGGVRRIDGGVIAEAGISTIRRACSTTCGSIVTATPWSPSTWSTLPPEVSVVPSGITSSRTTAVSKARRDAAGSFTSTPPCAICFTSAASSACVAYVMRSRTGTS